LPTLRSQVFPLRPRSVGSLQSASGRKRSLGVTSGIDFGLTVVAEIAGEQVAQSVQLGLEYDPAPPFQSGHPDRAPDTVQEAVFPRYEKARTAFRDGLARAAVT